MKDIEVTEQMVRSIVATVPKEEVVNILTTHLNRPPFRAPDYSEEEIADLHARMGYTAEERLRDEEADRLREALPRTSEGWIPIEHLAVQQPVCDIEVLFWSPTIRCFFPLSCELQHDDTLLTAPRQNTVTMPSGQMEIGPLIPIAFREQDDGSEEDDEYRQLLGLMVEERG